MMQQIESANMFPNVQANLKKLYSRGAVIGAGIDIGGTATGFLGRIGTLEKGKLADLIAVDGDPLKDLGVLTKPAMVMKGGVLIRHPGASPA